MRSGSARLLRGFAALSTGELIAKIAGFVAFAYLSRALGPPAYGAVELAVALVTMAGLVVDFGLGPVAAAEIARHPARATALVARVPALRLSLAAGAFLIVASTPKLLGVRADTSTLTWLFGTSLFLHSWTQNWLFQGLGKVSWAAPAQPLRMLCFAATVILFVHNANDLWIVGAAEIASVGLMVAYYLAAQNRLGFPIKIKWDSPFFRKLAGQAFPIAVSQLLWAVGQYIPTVLLAALITGSEVAWFGSSLRLVLALHTFVWLYYFNLYPTLVRTADSPGHELESVLRRSYHLTSWAGILIGLVGSLSADAICSVAYGVEFVQAGRVFAVLVWVVPVALLSGHARFSLIAYGHQKQELLSAAVGVATTFILCWLLIPHLAAIGAALAVLVAALLVWLTAYWLARRRIRGFTGARMLTGPATMGLAALVVGATLPWTHQWMSTMAAVGFFLCSALLLDRSLIRDIRELWRSR